MKIIIHGGFFSESSTNNETKVAKQKALLQIVRDSYAFLQTHSAIETVVYAVSLLEDDFQNAILNVKTNDELIEYVEKYLNGGL